MSYANKEDHTDWPERLRAWCKTDDRNPPIEEICETLEAYDRLEAACAELKAFISESEMPMHTSFSDADSIAWRKRREYLLSNKAGEQLLDRLKESEWLLANMRTSEVGYMAGSEWQVHYEAWKRRSGL